MNKFTLLYLYILLLNVPLVQCQKYDFKWLLGYSFADNPLDTGWGSSIMDFDTPDGNPVFYEKPYSKIDFHITAANICDENGNYLFASNGAYVEDSTDQLMLNSDQIGNETKYPNLGLALDQGALIIPYPGHKTQYLLFHKNLESIFPNGDLDVELFYSIIDMTGNNNRGKMISRKNSLIRDSLDLACLTALKHANGRDWWIILSEGTEVGYYIFLVSDKGVKFIRKQVFIGYKSKVAFGQSFFSNDGGYLVTTTSDDNLIIQNDNIYFFTFDRCDGLFGNSQHIVLPEQATWATGCTFSADSKYLYVVTLDSLYKFSIINNVLVNQKTIANYDGYQELTEAPNARANNRFGMLQQAADGRIYGMAPNLGCRLMDVINKPNESGEACDFRAHSVRCPTMKLCLPNFPNYRLGPIDGSICDSLGIDNIPWAHWRYDQDTLNYLKFEFTDLSAYEVEEWYWNFGDGWTSRDTNPIHTFSQNGVYEVCLIVKNENGADTLCRTLTIGTVSTKDHDKNIPDIQAWPNPCKDFLIINVLDYNPQKMVLHIHNSIGELVLSKRLYQGSNSIEVEDLHSGIYFISIQEKGKEIKSEKLIKL